MDSRTMRSIHLFILSFVAIWAFLPFAVTRTLDSPLICYDSTNGSALPNEFPWNQYVPCEYGRENARNVMCCFLEPQENQTKAMVPDVCMPNGLCREIASQDGGRNTYDIYWREHCSREDGNGCLDVCKGHPEEKDGSVPMTPCGTDWTTDRWCCGANNDKCCTNDNDPWLAHVPHFMDASLDESNNASGQSPNESPSASTQHGESGLSTGAQVGIGVGIAVGVISALIVGFLGGMVHQKRSDSKNPHQSMKSGSSTAQKKDESPELCPMVYPVEIDGHTVAK